MGNVVTELPTLMDIIPKIGNYPNHPLFAIGGNLINKCILVVDCDHVFGESTKHGMIPADLILSNARMYTVDPAQPWAEALAISGERILAVRPAAEVTA